VAKSPVIRRKVSRPRETRERPVPSDRHPMRPPRMAYVQGLDFPVMASIDRILCLTGQHSRGATATVIFRIWLLGVQIHLTHHRL